jgi:general secretion pathway protein C
MVTRWLAFAVWAAVAASAVAWGLRLFVASPPVPAHASVALPAPAVGDLARLFGAEPVPEPDEAGPEPVADARFQLIGVVAPRSPSAAREGVALISVDGKPPRAFRVGATVEGEQVLQSVQQRGATLGPRGGAAMVALSIPPPAPAATGTLPAAGVPPGVNRNLGMPGSFGAPGARMQQAGQPNPRYMPPGLRGNQPQPAPPADDAAEAPSEDAVEPITDGDPDGLPTR